MCSSDGGAPGVQARGVPRTHDDGFVTAETAVVIPVLVAVVAALIWGLMAVCARIECVDAARAGARAAARSEPRAAVFSAARSAAPGARGSPWHGRALWCAYGSRPSCPAYGG